MAGNKILLVDDEESIVKALQYSFEQEGYDVMTASSGEEAVEIIQVQDFDMLITDLSLPGIDGIEVLPIAKKNNPDLGVIFLTGYGDTPSAIEALRLGADDYLQKPCDTEELLLRVYRCLKFQEAFKKVTFYENILPVCIYCKSIRHDAGLEPDNEKWLRMEEYMHNKSDVDVSHCCPVCCEKHKTD